MLLVMLGPAPGLNPCRSMGILNMFGKVEQFGRYLTGFQLNEFVGCVIYDITLAENRCVLFVEGVRRTLRTAGYHRAR